MSDVEQERPACLLHVDGVLAGHAEADVVLGAEDVANLREDLGLMLANPEQLGEGEVGERGVGDELDQALEPDGGIKPVALRLCPLIAPDKSRPQHYAMLVEHHAAVHLAGKADGLDSAGRLVAGPDGAADGLLRGAPPVVGVLLGPADLGRADGLVLAGVRREDSACPVN